MINKSGNQETRNSLKPSLEELGCPTKLFITGGIMTKRIYLVNKICCINCKSEIKICNFEKHINGVSCKKGGTSASITKLNIASIGSNCKFCGMENHNKNSLVQHQLRCLSNPDKLKYTPSYAMLGKKGTNQYIKAKMLGLPKPVISNETRNKLKEASKNKVWTNDMRSNLSIAMKKAVINNPESYSAGNQGRAKVYEIDGVKLKGKWEVKFYLWCKHNDILVDRPSQGFEYEWNGSRLYFPDFYLPTYDLYVEVKGYETDRDRAKWKYFPHKLGIVRNNEIKQIDNNSFNIESIM